MSGHCRRRIRAIHFIVPILAKYGTGEDRLLYFWPTAHHLLVQQITIFLDLIIQWLEEGAGDPMILWFLLLLVLGRRPIFFFSYFWWPVVLGGQRTVVISELVTVGRLMAPSSRSTQSYPTSSINSETFKSMTLVWQTAYIGKIQDSCLPDNSEPKRKIAKKRIGGGQYMVEGWTVSKHHSAAASS